MNKGLELLERHKVYIDSLKTDVVPLSIAKEAITITLEESGYENFQKELENQLKILSESINSINKELNTDL